MKFVLVVVVVAVVLWLLLKRSSGPAAPGEQEAPDRPAGPKPATPKPLAMRVCAHCGLHLPPAEAVDDPQGRAYCSDAHRALGPR